MSGLISFFEEHVEQFKLLYLETILIELSSSIPFEACSVKSKLTSTPQTPA